MKTKTLKAGLRRIAAFAFVFTMLLGVIVSLPGIISTAEAKSLDYDTGFDWDNPEEDTNPWPLEAGVSKSGINEANVGIGTAGFSYRHYHVNNEGKSVLEFEISMFPENRNTSTSITFRDKWKYAKFYIDPRLIGLINKDESFFKMSYSTTNPDLSLSPKYFLNQIPTQDWEKTENSSVKNVFKIPVENVFPEMPTNSDYMKSKLYLVLNTTGNTLDTLKEDYAVAMRYYNADLKKVYRQTGSTKAATPMSTEVIGKYAYKGVNRTVASGLDDVNLMATAPFRTASMSPMYRNVFLPMDIYRSTGQTIVYDYANSKLIIYYKMAPNNYIYRKTEGGAYLGCNLGIAQTMDARLLDAFVPESAMSDKVGEMTMLDSSGAGWSTSITAPIRKGDFVYGTTAAPGVETRTWRMFAKDVGDIGGNYAIMPATSQVTDVYLHGHKDSADYVRFVYDVDRDKMDALFGDSNIAGISLATSYIAMDSSYAGIKQQTYTLESRTEDINIAPGGTIVFTGTSAVPLPPTVRGLFRVGLGTNYQRTIGNLKKEGVQTGDPPSNGEGYSVAPYVGGTSESCTLTVETGLRIGKDQKVTLTLFDAATGLPDAIKMKIGGTTYTLNKDFATTNANKVYDLPNAVARSGIIIYRRANTPHVNEIFTTDANISGHSKYSTAEISANIADGTANGIEFTKVGSASAPVSFNAEGKSLIGYAFTLNLPAGKALKKDMEIKVYNSDFDEFFLKSIPSTYRVQAKVSFDKNISGAPGEIVDRIVPINKNSYAAGGYAPNGFEGDNVLYLNATGDDWTGGTKYLPDYEGRPIIDQESEAHKNRLFYGKASGDNLSRENYTFLGWSTKKINPEDAIAKFSAPQELTNVSQWEDANPDNIYKFTANSPVDQARTVYAVWVKTSDITTPLSGIEIDGTAEVGKTLNAINLKPDGATATYQWFRSTGTGESYEAISDATAATYTLTAGDFGKLIKVVASGFGQYKGQAEAVTASTVAAAPLTNVSIEGAATVGKTLTAAGLAPEGATATYQWLVSDTAGGSYAPIEGATGSTFILREEDYGKYIKVEATGEGSYTGKKTSGEAGPVTHQLVFADLKAYDIPEGIKGVSYTSDLALSATGGTGPYIFSVDPAVNGLSVVDGKLQYSRPEQLDSPITATIKVIDSTYPVAASETIEIQIGRVYLPLTFTGPYNISGLKAGQSIADANIAPHTLNMFSYVSGGKGPYSFSSSGFPYGLGILSSGIISGAPTLTADAGTATIKVIDSLGNEASATVNYAAVGKGNLTAVDIVGTPKVGETLAAEVAPFGATATYKWFISVDNSTYTEIVGATDSTYVVQSGDYNKYIKVEATGTDSYTGVETSDATTQIAPAPLRFPDNSAYDIPEGTAGVTYTSVTALLAIDGTPPYTFSIVASGVSGLSINPDNQLVYTRPAGQGAATATIQVKDGADATRTITIDIGKVNSALQFPDNEAYDIPAGITGVSYTADTPLTASGGTAPYVFTIDSPPAGLSINDEYKLVFARPAAGAAGTATVRVTDKSGASETITIAIGKVESVYSLSYDGNGNTGGQIPADPQPYTYNSDVIVLGNVNATALERSGYTFAGWHTNAAGSGGTDYAAGDTFKMPEGNITLYAKWTGGVTYKANGGSGTPPADPSAYLPGETVSVKANTDLTKLGYTFGGWNTRADGKGTNYAAGSDSFAMTGDIDLYAKWDAIPYTVTYDKNSGTGDVPSDANSYTIAQKVIVQAKPANLARIGYTFAGWHTNAAGSGGTDYAAGESFNMPADNVTLYAKWTGRVTYDANGGSGTPPNDASAYLPGAEVTALGNTGGLTKSGYTFDGWNTAADGSGTSRAADSKFPMEGSITLYAKWKPVDYSITYYGNNNTAGTAAVDTTKYHVGDSATIALQGGLVKTGYTFDGWYTNASGTGGIAYAAGGNIIMPAGNLDLYAKWNPNNYNVSYYGNGSDDDTSAPIATTQRYGDVVTVKNKGALTKTGYTFSGWHTDPDGIAGTSYAVGETFAMPASNLKLYAQWTLIPIAFTASGEYNIPASTVGTAITPIDVSGGVSGGAKPYTFTASGLPEGLSISGAGVISGAPSDKKAAGTATITVKDALNNVATITINYGKITIPLTSVTISGEAVVGKQLKAAVEPSAATVTYKWQRSVDGVNYTDIDGATTDTYTLGEGDANRFIKVTAIASGEYSGQKDAVTASKVAPVYSVSYDANESDGGNVPTDTNAYQAGSTVNVPGNTGSLVKTGYIFNGWNTEANGGGDPYAADGSGSFNMPAHNVTLYAQWTPIDYTLTYSGNGNDDGTAADAVTKSYNTSISLADKGTLKKTGYTFSGWNTKADGSGTAYAAGGSFKVIENSTLYAQWTIGKFSLSYDGNGSDSGTAPASTTQNYGTVVTVKNKGTLAKSGYKFDGWATQADGGGTVYNAGDSYTLGDAPVTLYARWIAQVSYNGNGNDGGTVPKDDNVYLPGVNVTVLDNTGGLTKNGYNFAGWNTKQDGTGENRSIGGTFAMGGDITLYAQWTAANYIVSYSGNLSDGGSVPSVPKSYAFNSTVQVEQNVNALTRIGYSFKGWNTAANGSGTPYAADGSAGFSMPAADVTLYAQWTAIDYTVTYYGNGNDGGTAPATVTKHYQDNVIVESQGTLTKTGYTFAGWTTQEDGGGTSYAAGGNLVMPASDVKLYAKWTATNYNLTYDGNGNTAGQVPAAPAAHTYNSDVTVLGNVHADPLVRTGYTFAGWNTQANGGGTPYAAGATYTMPAGNATLYAQWTKNKYSFSHDVNQGVGAIAPQTGIVYDTLVKADSGAGISRSGYIFTGWNTKADGSGNPFAPSAEFKMPAEDFTLFAQWTAINYNVIYNGNGSDGGSVPTDATNYNVGGLVTVKDKGSLIKNGYSFAGWNTAANGSGTSYAADGSFGMPAANVTLYAQWTTNSYTVSYSGNESDSGSVPKAATDYNYGAEVTVEPNTNNFKKAGYTFAGWNSKADGTGTDYAPGAKFSMPEGALTLYVKWAKNSYALSYNANGGSGTLTPAAAVPYNAAVTTDDATGISREGYVFAGWNTQADGGGDSYAASAPLTMPAGNVSLYAQWTKKIYALKYNLNGGSGTLPADDNPLYEATVKAAGKGDISKAGYTFAGWNSKADGTGTYYAADANFSMPAEDLTLYVNWAKGSYSLSYNANGGSGTLPADAGVLYGASVTTDGGTGINKTGYKFTGWNTAYDGSGTPYAASASFDMPPANVTLYAQWAKDSYSLSYDANGGGVNPPSVTVVYNASVTPDDGLTLSKAGYKFAGWNSAADGSGTDYPASASFDMPAGDLTLYAKWTANEYNLIYNANGGSGTLPADTKVNTGASFTTNDGATINREGYTFNGWNSAADGNGTPYAANSNINMPAGDLTLYAQWTKKNFNLSYDANGGTGAVPGNSTPLYQAALTADSGANISRSGYKFSGWNSAKNGSGTDYVAGAGFEMPAKDLTLYAQWTANSYTLSYNTNGGSGTVDPASAVLYDAFLTAASGASIKKAGYTFAGWNSAADGSGDPYAKGSSFTMPAGDLTLYAQWTKDSYSLNYHLNDGGGPLPAGGSYAYNDPIAVSVSTGISKTGYKFTGWNSKADGTGTDYVAGQNSTMPSENLTLYAKWSAENYTLSYNANGVSGNVNPQTGILYNASVILDSGAGITPAGYKFEGWNTKADGSGQTYAGGSSLDMPAGDLTLYAKWSMLSYTISYDANGGGGDLPQNMTYAYNSIATVAYGNSMVWAGYDFAGWNTAANGSGNSYARMSKFVMPAYNLLLFAQWTPINYNVVYDGNGSDGGSLPVDPSSYKVGATVTAKDKGTLSRKGYSLVSWNTNAYGSGNSYAADGSKTFTMPPGNVTLYAQWTKNKYNLKYDVNSGSGGGSLPADSMQEYDATLTAAVGTGISRIGYKFEGWSTAADGNGQDYAAGMEFNMPAGDLTLYAKWTANSYLLIYNANGGNGNLPAASIELYGAGVTAAGGAGINRAGYSFVNWNTEPDGSGNSYAADGSGIFNMPAHNVTLYAQWAESNYKLKYDLNGGSGGLPAASDKAYNASITADGGGTISRAGYSFVGWNSRKDGSGKDYAAGMDFNMPAEDLTLYAKWTPKSYILMYNANGGSGGLPGASVELCDAPLIADGGGAISRAGYTFAGWNTAADGSGDAYAASAPITMPAGNLTLYAQWNAQAPGLIFTASPAYNIPTSTVGSAIAPINVSGGVSGGTAPYSYSATGLPAGITINPATGVISGAPTTAGIGGTATVSVKDGAGAIKSISINYGPVSTTAVPLSYTVIYDANGSTGGVVPVDSLSPYDAGANVSVKGNIGGLIKTAYIFSGWNTAADGSGTDYAAGSNFNMPAANLILYAKWTKAPTYSVSYYANGSEGGNAPTDAGAYKVGDTVIVLGNSGGLTKAGYNFAGWNTEANGSGTDYAAGNSFVIGTADVSLYAKWRKSLSFAGGAGYNIPASTLGTPIGALDVSGGVSGGTAPYAYSASGLPAGLAINPATGVISGTPTAQGAAGTATVTVADDAGASESITISYGAILPAGSFTFTDSSAYDIPASTQGTAIVNIDVSGGVSNGTAPYNYSATGLPAGISISAAGVISGTPTAPGAAGTATITVTDGNSDSRSITINYGKIAAALSLTHSPACDIPASTVGKAIANVDIKTSAGFSGGTAPQVFSAAGLPAGLNINPWTGVIYGAPTAAGATGTATVTVTDGAGATKSITINYGAISLPSTGGGGGGVGSGGDAASGNPYERNPVGSTPIYPAKADAKEKAYIDKMFYLRQVDLRLFVNIPYTELPKATIEYNEPYIVGFEDVTFRGDTPLTRIQLVTIFSKLLKKTDADIVPISYEDMDDSSTHWGRLFLQRLESAKMFSGYPDGEFKPDKAMTRAEFASMIVNFWRVRGYEPDKRTASFADIQNHWAKEYISAMYNTGLMNSYEDGLFHPEDPITRSETVMIINKLLNRAHVYPYVPTLKDLNPNYWDYGAAEASAKYSQGTLWD